jgi:hypothetical protein
MFQTTNQVIYHSLEVVAGGMKSEMRTWFVFLDQYSSQSHWKLKVADDLTKQSQKPYQSLESLDFIIYINH